MQEPRSSIADILRAHAFRRPDDEALVDPHRSLTYRALDESSDRCASALLRDGVTTGDRVAFIGSNSAEFVELLFGCAKAGAVLAPIHSRLGIYEQAAVLRTCLPSLLVVDEEWSDRAREAADRAGLGAIPTVVIGAAAHDRDFAGWWGSAPQLSDRSASHLHDLACLTFTSGTTGAPKGVMIRHASFTGFPPATLRDWGLDESAVSLTAIPLSHIGGLAWFMSGFLAGARSILLPSSAPDPILDAIEGSQVTHVQLVVTLLQSLTDRQQTRRADVSSLRAVLCGASPMPAVHLERAMTHLGCQVIAVYGLSEAGGLVSQHRLVLPHAIGARPERLLSAGLPVEGVQLRISDLHDGSIAPTGRTGEILVHTPAVMAGYWADPEGTRAVLDEDGWLHTGDIGYLADDGHLYVKDRLKDLIISGGENIVPAEVEAVIAQFPGVADVCVIGIPHMRWGETPVAVVATADGSPLDVAALSAWCRDRLAHFKCPTRFVSTSSLPRNATGKVARAEVRSLVGEPAGIEIGPKSQRVDKGPNAP